MNDPFVSRVGGIVSADIAVPEHEREVRFYSRILNTGKNPLWREDLMNNRGMPVIGLGARSPEYDQLPLQWMPHIQVADVAVSAERALAQNGKELMHGKDEDGNSQWAVLLDPNGTAFGIIPVVPAEALQAGKDASSGDASAPVGCIAWLDLTVPNAEAIRDFYSQVVGWSVQEVGMQDADNRYADYNMICEDGNPGAGICHARGVNKGLPPVWMLYLPVGDLAESLRRVEEEGGKIIKTSTGANGKIATAAIQDPVGACFALAAG